MVFPGFAPGPTKGRGPFDPGLSEGVFSHKGAEFYSRLMLLSFFVPVICLLQPESKNTSWQSLIKKFLMKLFQKASEDAAFLKKGGA